MLTTHTHDRITVEFDTKDKNTPVMVYLRVRAAVGYRWGFQCATTEYAEWSSTFDVADITGTVGDRPLRPGELKLIAILKQAADDFQKAYYRPG